MDGFGDLVCGWSELHDDHAKASAALRCSSGMNVWSSQHALWLRWLLKIMARNYTGFHRRLRGESAHEILQFPVCVILSLAELEFD